MSCVKIDNKYFKEQLILCKESKRPNKELTKIFIGICDGISKKIIVKRFQDLEDLKQAALLDILENWLRFDANKNNPHAYFTTIAKNSMQFNNKKLYEHHKKIKPDIVSYEEYVEKHYI